MKKDFLKYNESHSIPSIIITYNNQQFLLLKEDWEKEGHFVYLETFGKNVWRPPQLEAIVKCLEMTHPQLLICFG